MNDLVYVCHPYSNNPWVNCEKIKKICRKIFEQGDIPIAPQLFLPQFIDEGAERKKAMKVCIALMERCDFVNVYGDELSVGMKEELQAGVWAGSKIRFIGEEVEEP